MASGLTAPYLLALCNAARDSGFSFGVAMQLGAQHSEFEVDATRLIHSMITFSPASESLAIEFLQQFQGIPSLEDLIKPVLLLYCETNMKGLIGQK